MKDNDESEGQATRGLDHSLPSDDEPDMLKRKLQWAQESQALAVRILNLLNRQIAVADTIRGLLEMVKDFTRFDAVAIRLRDGDDFPYFETKGFPADFVEAERSLCIPTGDGGVVRDSAGRPVLECMCGNILLGRTNPSLSFFTDGGSFWSGNTTELLATTTERERQARTRNRCNGVGYESVALIPLRSGSETIGLLQLNDSRTDRFTPDMITFFEGIGASIGVVLERKKSEEALRDAQHELELRVEKRTSDLKTINERLLSEIGERKSAEKQLQREKNKLRGILGHMNDGVYIVSSRHEIEYVNPAMEMTFGLIAGQNCYEYFHDRSEPCPWCRNAEVLAGGSGTWEWHYEKTGKTYELFCTPIGNSDGSVSKLQIFHDITHRKQAEAALKESERRFRAILDDVSSIPVQGYDETRRVVFWNTASERLYGYSREDALGKQLEELIIPPSMRADVITAVTNWVTQGEQIPAGELGLMHKDGSVVPVYSSHVMLENSRGEKEMYCVDLDLTGIKKAEKDRVTLGNQLRQAQKMEAIGTLAGGLAHDFNNLLQVILGYSELLLSQKHQEDLAYPDLQKIHHAARSGADLVRRLLTFSRKVEVKPVPVNLNNQVRSVEELIRRTIPRMIDIRLELEEGLRRTQADPAQIEQIIMNLAVNAKDAMGEEGTLSIRTQNVTLDEEYCRFHVEALPGECVMLSVTDTGQGMDRATLEHIFEPFFTTKKSGRGTGLGLAMVYGMVKQHGGHVDCSSEVGRGTTFNLYFPAVAMQTELADESFAEMPALGMETVLLVDDEGLVRELGERILRRSGYTVLTAANGREALDKFGEHKEEIDLIILDLIMPVMGGKDCLNELLTRDPKAKVLVASGYSSDAPTGECLALGAKGFVAKPFRFKEFLKQVREILDES